MSKAKPESIRDIVIRLLDITSDAINTNDGKVELPLKQIEQSTNLLLALCDSYPDYAETTELLLLKILLDHDAAVNQVDPETGHTPLYRCVLYKQLHKAECLLSYGKADPNVLVQEERGSDEEPRPPLSCLAKAASLTYNPTPLRDYGMVNLLLKHGASVKLAPRMAFIVLRDRELEVMRMVVAAGFDPSETLGYSEDATLLDATFFRSVYLEKDLLRCLSDHAWSWQIHDSVVANFLSLYQNDLDFMRLFLEAGCPTLSPMSLLYAVDKNAFLTLTDTYSLYLQTHRTMVWPEDVLETCPSLIRDDIPPEAEAHVLSAADNLKNLIQRTGRLSRNSQHILRFLRNGFAGRRRSVEIPTLMDLSADAVLAYTITHPGKDGMEQLSLPRNVKRKLGFLREFESRSDATRAALHSAVLRSPSNA
ncbi:hypothetical protein BV898_00320 [Hypsibius exemplaris]|uniref:Uncharacterized protein n=1 Tax=Hypsibius exemplaris TaxID=2072580 RepID=A0A1W0XFR9_HYPEX|nr:hypothetical protein BV898_00320 [Hypsibius exemplaris]